MMESIVILIQLYMAFTVVVFLHELGHVPTKGIKFKFGILPSASATAAYFRLGGLIVNAALFIAVAFYKPENVFLQYIGLLSWIHFIFYLIVGSIVPEPKESAVNLKTYVFDDVPNEHAVLAWIIAGASFLFYNSYYIAILKGIIPW
jgi:hypothetical protein